MQARMWRGSSHIVSKVVQPLGKTVGRFEKQLKIKLPHDPAVPFLGYINIFKEKTLIQKETCASLLIAALFVIPKT